jgi:hypothetical protein
MTSIWIFFELISSRLVLNFFTDSSKPQWLGIFYAILLSITVFCQVMFLQAYYQCQFPVGLRCRAAIMGLIYRKVHSLHYSLFHWFFSVEFEIVKFIPTGNNHWRNCQSSSYIVIYSFILLWYYRWPLTLHVLLMLSHICIVYGQVCYIHINRLILRLFSRSTSSYFCTCFTLSTNAMVNHSRCCIIIDYDSN